MERREKHKDLNPFTIIDDLQGNKLTNSPKQIPRMDTQWNTLLPEL